MTTKRKAVRKEHIGKPIEFYGADGVTYYGHVIEVLQRGIHVRYYVPEVARECDAHILNENIRQRVKVL